MISPNIRRWFWGCLVGINTLMILFNGAMAMYDWAIVNFLSALGCWVGFFIAEKDLNKENENGD